MDIKIKRISQYVLVESVPTINLYLEQGWELYGTPTYNAKTGFIAQAMIKYEDEPTKTVSKGKKNE